jgi:hypothetical protein
MLSCSPYVCVVTGCKTSCVSNTDCAAGFTCSGGSCVPLGGPGASCVTGSQCASGLCVSGVCQ